MKNRFFPSLMAGAETFTPEALGMAPELLTMAALDASLLATCEALSEGTSPWTEPWNKMDCERDLRPAKPVAEAICILAKALRTNLAAYHAAIQEACGDEDSENAVEF